MKKNSNKNLFVTLVMALVIVIIGIFIGNAGNNPTSNQDNSSSAKTNSDTGTTEALSTSNLINELNGTIIYASRTSAANEIYSVTVNTQPKKVYTDKNDDLKIKSMQSVTRSGKILAVMAPEDQQFGGSLYLISTDGSGKKDKLIDEFASTQTPVISPNSKKIAYIVFNNAETDYGFSLYVMNTDGTSKQKIASNPDELKIMSWNYTGDKISYLKGDSLKQSDIYYSDLSGNETKLISYKEKIYSLSFGQNKIVLTKGPLDKLNQSEVYRTDLDGKNIKRVTTDENHENFCVLSPDDKAEACLRIDYSKNVDLSKSGEIMIFMDGSNKKLSDGNYIIGWY